jgi:hypothetical protein
MITTPHNDREDGVSPVVVCRPHQVLAEEISKGTTIGANLIAEVLSLLDGEEEVPQLKVARISNLLLDRHSHRSIRRVFRRLLDAGLLTRTWPKEEPHPVYQLEHGALRRALADPGTVESQPVEGGRDE